MFKIKRITSSTQSAAEKVQAVDLIVVEDLARQVWNEHYGSILSQGQIDYMLEKFQSVDAIQQQIAEGYEYYLIEYQNAAAHCMASQSAPDGCIPVGYFSIKAAEDFDSQMKLFLSKLYILKEFRGMGAGRTVFHFLEQKAKANCLKAIWLTVNKYNKDSISVYQHSGYEIVREQVADIGNGYIMDDYIMHKSIS